MKATELLQKLDDHYTNTITIEATYESSHETGLEGFCVKKINGSLNPSCDYEWFPREKLGHDVIEHTFIEGLDEIQDEVLAVGIAHRTRNIGNAYMPASSALNNELLTLMLNCDYRLKPLEVDCEDLSDWADRAYSELGISLDKDYVYDDCEGDLEELAEFYSVEHRRYVDDMMDDLIEAIERRISNYLAVAYMIAEEHSIVITEFYNKLEGVSKIGCPTSVTITCDPDTLEVRAVSETTL